MMEAAENCAGQITLHNDEALALVRSALDGVVFG